MPQPTQQQVHIDAALTTMSVAYVQQASDFIATRVFPVIPSDKQSNLYFIYNKNDWFRDEAQPRADTTESAGSGYNLSTTNYLTRVYAMHKDVGDQVLANSDLPLNPLADASKFVAQRLLLRLERQWAADFMGAGVWGTDLTGVASAPSAGQFTQWSNYAGSDPIADLKTGRAAILSVTGFHPNTLVLGWLAYQQLRDHPDVIDRYKYTSSRVITPDLLAPLFEVDRVLVAPAIYATNNEGETPAYSFIHGKNALLCYSNTSPSVLAPSSGYTFMWNGVSGGLGQTIGVSQFRLPHLAATRVEGQIAFANKLVGADLGVFYASAVA